MTKTPIEVLMEAARLGLKLGTRPGDKLTFEPAERCPPDFVETLRAHKWHLLSMLSWPFVMVDSKAVGELLFFCKDEATKAALVEAGAEEWRIYTREELRILVEQNRIKPFTDAELQKLHEIKRSLGAQIVPEKLGDTKLFKKHDEHGT
jgi:hypothetical protein